jgi:drug/metabolite transporter (DMT)-like permease
MLKYGNQITREALSVPQYKWAVMGFLDSVAGIMQSLSVNYVSNGSLVTLLMQFAIPSSMIISYIFLKTRYKPTQYLGALIVLVGLVIVLLPTFMHPGSNKSAKNPVAWAIVLMLSCVPMCLSSVYKEKALGDVDIDPVYMNGWVAVYQFLFSIPLLLPSAVASNVSIQDLPDNLWNGMRCLAKYDTQMVAADGLTVDNCHWGPAYVGIYIMFNVGYNILIILILKYGSSNVLWLAMTVMVPLTNFSFTLPFMPNRQNITWEDVVGLCVIMAGLLIYRFYEKLKNAIKARFAAPEPAADNTQPLLIQQSPSMATPLRGTMKHVGKPKGHK